MKYYYNGQKIRTSENEYNYALLNYIIVKLEKYIT